LLTYYIPQLLVCIMHAFFAILEKSASLVSSEESIRQPDEITFVSVDCVAGNPESSSTIIILINNLFEVFS